PGEYTSITLSYSVTRFEYFYYMSSPFDFSSAINLNYIYTSTPRNGGTIDLSTWQITTLSDGMLNYNDLPASFKLPSSLVTIESAVMRDYYNEVSFDLSGCTNLTTIANNAFTSQGASVTVSGLDGCTKLQTIGANAFSGVTFNFSMGYPNRENQSSSYITSLDFSRCTNLTSIGDFAFMNCTGGDEKYDYGYEYTVLVIKIPASLTSIGTMAFALNANVTEISVDANNPVYDSRNNCNALIHTASNTLIRGSSSTVIPSNITSIGDYAFTGCSDLHTVTIPASVTYIGYYAFDGCSSLTSATFVEPRDWLVVCNSSSYSYTLYGTTLADTSKAAGCLNGNYTLTESDCDYFNDWYYTSGDMYWSRH
ncbi:MAG: leucine-rich repeat domain-containing protein, partial [Clostridia bacterium]